MFSPLFKLWLNVERRTSNVERSPGELIAVGDEVIVACGEGALRLLEVQLSGKQRMAASVFARGARLSPGSRLG